MTTVTKTVRVTMTKTVIATVTKTVIATVTVTTAVTGNGVPKIAVGWTVELHTNWYMHTVFKTTRVARMEKKVLHSILN